MVIMQNKKANEFSPTPRYFHEMNVMMALFAIFFLLLASQLLIPVPACWFYLVCTMPWRDSQN